MPFTFKTTRATGHYRSFHSDQHDIKIKKVVVGMISDRDWVIRLQVTKKDINEDGNPNCPWKWITLKKQSASLEEAKEFLNRNYEAIRAKFNIHIDKEN